MNQPLPFPSGLARLYGVQTVYQDVFGHERVAAPEALLSVLRSLGAPLAGVGDLLSAYRSRRLDLWQRLIEPVSVAWAGRPDIRLRLPEAHQDTKIAGSLILENGQQRGYLWRASDLALLRKAEIEGTWYAERSIPLTKPLPYGYHRLVIEMPGKRAEALIISAPLKAYLPEGARSAREWGVFLPLYALHTRRGWGSGDYTALKDLMRWAGSLGGRLAASLPLLPVFLDGLPEPSPYLPASRQLWNEFYIDVARAPGLESCPRAVEMLQSSWLQEAITGFKVAPIVDYVAEMKLKRRLLEEMARGCFAGGAGLAEVEEFARSHPLVEEYARFRAARDRYGVGWPAWPEPLREGKLTGADYNEDDRRYHLYAQWLAQRQFSELADHARQDGMKLYLDLPMGIHPDGFDIWREPGLFLPGATAGAPPDNAFPSGQDWAFPPLHPERIREQSYRYVIGYTRHHLAHSGVLRIDHVMGLHRLFVVPRGLGPAHGVYVRYPAEELYAILTLESQRSRTMLVGEDLGTVPPQVRPAMSRHGLYRTYVLYYGFEYSGALRSPPRRSVASLNTHDMPPFAAFWKGQDIERWLKLGMINEEEARNLRGAREWVKGLLVQNIQAGGLPYLPDEAVVLRGCLGLLAASRARIVLINLEDLWLETEPQNIPGTHTQYPNWRRRARYDFETFREMPGVSEALLLVDSSRRRKAKW